MVWRRSCRRTTLAGALALGALVVVGSNAVASPPSPAVVARSDARAIVERLAPPPDAVRVDRFAPGTSPIATASPLNGQTEVADVMTFYEVSNPSAVLTWMDARGSSLLAFNEVGSSSHFSAPTGYDAIWSVNRPGLQSDVVYNMTAAIGGRASLRVDVDVFWSPHFNALSHQPTRVELLVTRMVVTGVVTVVMTARQAGSSGRTCSYRTYRAIRDSPKVVRAPSRIRDLVHYLNSRSVVDVNTPSAGVNMTWCSARQVAPPAARFTLRLFRGPSRYADVHITGALSRTTKVVTAVAVIAHTRPTSRRGAALDVVGLSGVSLSALERLVG